MTARHFTIAAIIITLLGCSDKREETSEPEAAPAAYYDSGSNADDEDASKDEDGQENQEPPSFRGYPCTVDCSGHEAGYQWAEEKGIADPDDCSGNSNSFVEGCRAYAEEQ